MRGFSFSFLLCFFGVFLWIKCKLHGKKLENGGNEYYENGK
jgi:hypothetical protein